MHHNSTLTKSGSHWPTLTAYIPTSLSHPCPINPNPCTEKRKRKKNQGNRTSSYAEVGENLDRTKDMDGILELANHFYYGTCERSRANRLRE